MRRLVAFVCLLGGLSAAAVGRAETVETPYLRLRFTALSGTFDVLQVDLQGKGRFGPNLIGGLGRGICVTSLPAGGAWTKPVERTRPDVERRDSGEGPGLIVRGLSHGPGVTETLQVTLAPDAPTLTLRRQVRIVENGQYVALGLVRLALDPGVAGPTICFAGREGVPLARTQAPGGLSDPDFALAGAVSKQGNATFAVTSQANLTSSVVYDAQGICGVGLSVWDAGPAGSPRPVSAGEIYQHAVTITFGPQAAAQWTALKVTASRFDPRAEEFIFWCSHLGTTRPFGALRLQATASVLDASLPPAVINAYQFCWLRDVAHGWKSGMYVAGPSMLRIMRDEIEAFAGHLDDRGWAPTYLGPQGEVGYGNLDGMGLLIGMIYDFVSKTGDLGFLQATLPAARRCAWAILALQGPRGLPVIGDQGDTYPDLGFIKGEQTYLAAVCYDGLHKMSALCSVLGYDEEAERWRAAGERIKDAANKDVSIGGLWDSKRGIYIGWRKPDGTLYENEESFANLIAVHSGMCDDSARIKAVFNRLNDKFQRYYLDGLCPTAHSVAPYPNGLNQWCPWIAGWDILERAAHGAPRTGEVVSRYLQDYAECDYPFQEATGYHQAQPSVGNRGRVWDSWGLLAMFYGAHYGISMRPANLRVSPHLLKAIENDGVRDLQWQGARLEIAVEGDGPEVTQVSLLGSNWPSSILPKMSGRVRVNVKMGQSDSLFLLDASPEAELLGASRESPRRLTFAVRLYAGGPTRYLVRCPEGTAKVNVEVRERASAQVVYDEATRRATISVNAPRAMRLHLAVEAEPKSPSA